MYDLSTVTNSIYIHWPFCPYRCHFCPFVALASHEKFMNQYHNALKKEISFFCENNEKKEFLKTVFLGGGTPSTYPDSLLLDMFAKLKEKFDICSNAEVSIEVNPGTVHNDQLTLWKDIGINRLSIGVQSLNDSVLRNLNRLQKSEDVRTLLSSAAFIFDNISIDLILGLPGVSQSEWKSLLKRVVTWPLKHISIYFLTIHENTQLYFGIKKNKVEISEDGLLIDLYHWSVNFLERYGFNRYETSNFAKPGFECRHNIVYWNRKPYKGFGLGACSFDGKSRFQNQKNLVFYLKSVQNCESCVSTAEVLTKEQIKLEKIMLGLRRSCGVLISDLFEDLSEIKRVKLEGTIDLLKRHNYIKQMGQRIVLTSDAFVLQNDIAVRLSL